MPSPVCATCNTAMKKVDSGIVVEFTRRGKDTQHPYQKFSGDEYKCFSCSARVITSFGGAIQHHDTLYPDLVPSIIVPE